MWQFIISGYVPGTNIQITFDMVALAASIGLLLLLVNSLLQRRIHINRELKELMRRIETIKEISL